MNRLRANGAAIKTLLKAKPPLAKAMIKHADKELITALCECCLNIAKGRVPLTPPQKSRLKKHKKVIRDLLQKGKSLNARKKLIQRGGFLPALAAPLLSLLGPILGGIMGR